nr:MAG TPA: hypothetical protein [Caudoviricetes sp.]
MINISELSVSDSAAAGRTRRGNAYGHCAASANNFHHSTCKTNISATCICNDLIVCISP